MFDVFHVDSFSSAFHGRPEQQVDTIGETIAGAIILLWALIGAALAPISAFGVSKRRAWSLYTTTTYALLSLPSLVGTPFAILAILVLSRATVRGALGASRRSGVTAGGPQ
jgi:hypothetical protein